MGVMSFGRLNDRLESNRELALIVIKLKTSEASLPVSEEYLDISLDHRKCIPLAALPSFFINLARFSTRGEHSSD